ncbi:SulP family inorganic anion transporter [Diaminobutyricibacter sp. McL0608]|uniref:SulP family inorganic anion transporter n=1 Tax=Leifsonia sp. McL0608 TaxID=3143537 RepID=UPI0031F32245
MESRGGGATISTAAATVSRRKRWFAPTLAGYGTGWIAPDLIAGLSAGAVVIPQAMAYATIANMPVQIGLYTCMVPMVVYVLLGGSKAMSVSTTSTIATLTATTLVAAGVAGGSAQAERDLVTLTFLVGVILILGRLLRLGSLIESINPATLIGIKVGVGATVAVGQLPKLLGVDTDFSGHGFIRSLVSTVEALPEANLATVLLSVASIAVLVLFGRFAPRVPGQLIVVVGGILLAAYTGITDAGVRLIPPVPEGIPAPTMPTFQDVGALVPGALAIAVMAFLESAAVARALRQGGEPQVDSNRELFATGVANLAGSFFYSLPPAGGFSQSAINQRAGARSQLASLVTAVLAVLVALFLAPVLSNLPQATLAAMVFVAVFALIDIPGMVRLARLDSREFWISLVTAVIGLTVGLLAAVAAGVLLTLFTVLHELNRQRVSGSEPFPGGIVISLFGGLYSANVLRTLETIEGLAADAAPIRYALLDASPLRLTSVAVVDALTDLDGDLAATGVEFHIAGLPEGALEIAGKMAWWKGLVEAGRVHPDVAEAIAELSARS